MQPDLLVTNFESVVKTFSLQTRRSLLKIHHHRYPVTCKHHQAKKRNAQSVNSYDQQQTAVQNT